MAWVTTVYVNTITWNSNTWTSISAGGPIRVDISHAGQDIQDRTGGDEYSTFVQVVNKILGATIFLRALNTAGQTLGTKSNMVCTLTGKGGTVTLTLTGMVIVSCGPSQGRAEPGTVAMGFVHESSDGTTVPIAVS